MQNSADKTTKTKLYAQDVKRKNGLQNLVAYYQSLFDRKENLDYYSADDFQNAKRCFVKYLLEKRDM